MCTTNNSTKKRGARACKPARNTSSHPKKNDERARRPDDWGVGIAESWNLSATGDITPPRLDKNAAMCSKEIDVLIPRSR